MSLKLYDSLFLMLRLCKSRNISRYLIERKKKMILAFKCIWLFLYSSWSPTLFSISDEGSKLDGPISALEYTSVAFFASINEQHLTSFSKNEHIPWLRQLDDVAKMWMVRKWKISFSIYLKMLHTLCTFFVIFNRIFLLRQSGSTVYGVVYFWDFVIAIV